MSTLNQAIQIACDAHKDQFDKSGQPYIFHPIRVMMSLDTEDERIVGVLHDVLEDCPRIELRLLAFSIEIREAIKSVTRNRGESYFDFIKRAKQNVIGRKVKLADLKDNMNWERIGQPRPEDMKRMQKYQKAYFMLMEE